MNDATYATGHTATDPNYSLAPAQLLDIWTFTASYDPSTGHVEANFYGRLPEWYRSSTDYAVTFAGPGSSGCGASNRFTLKAHVTNPGPSGERATVETPPGFAGSSGVTFAGTEYDHNYGLWFFAEGPSLVGKDFRCVTDISATKSALYDYSDTPSIDVVDSVCLYGPSFPVPGSNCFAATSPEGTTITPGSGTIIDAQGRAITVSADGFIYRDGQRLGISQDVIRVVYTGGTVVQYIKYPGWSWAWNDSTNTWDLLTSPPPDPTPPANGGGSTGGGSTGGGSSGNSGSASGSGTNVNVQVINHIQVAGVSVSVKSTTLSATLKLGAGTMRALTRKGLATRITCKIDCRATGRLTRHGKTVATAASVQGRAGRPLALKFKAAKSQLAALKQLRRGTFTLRITTIDGGGHRATITRTVTLR